MFLKDLFLNSGLLVMAMFVGTEVRAEGSVGDPLLSEMIESSSLLDLATDLGIVQLPSCTCTILGSSLPSITTPILNPSVPVLDPNGKEVDRLYKVKNAEGCEGGGRNAYGCTVIPCTGTITDALGEKSVYGTCRRVDW